MYYHAAGISWKSTNDIQWNGFVQLLPLWLAPNLVTLLGFMFILVNVLFVSIFIPDLVGPVHLRCSYFSSFTLTAGFVTSRARHGYIIALHLDCGCE
jgi:hypothetical protein